MEIKAGERGALHRAADRVEQFVEGGQVWVALTMAAVLVLIQLPFADSLLAEVGLENNVRVRTAIAVILLASILLELRQLNRRVTPAITGRQHYPDPDEMYEALKEKARGIADPEHSEIKVLGLTLFSAWPVIQFFLERPEITDWTVRLATLSRHSEAARGWIPDSWLEETGTITTQVREFAASHGKDHTIELYEYDFMPSVHGFRLGNGDVFLSTLLWQADGRLGKHRFAYDYIPGDDVSPKALAARELFNNWFARAVLSSEEMAENALVEEGDAVGIDSPG